MKTQGFHLSLIHKQTFLKERTPKYTFKNHNIQLLMEVASQTCSIFQTSIIQLSKTQLLKLDKCKRDKHYSTATAFKEVHWEVED